MTKTVAMVSMKGHSARIPRKNLRELSGHPLFYWILDSLLNARRISEVIVETDCDEIATSVSSHFPNLRILRRPQALLGDDVSMNLLIAHNISQVSADVYLQTHSTNPLLTTSTIDKALERFADRSNDQDSLFGVTEWRTRLYWPNGSTINHDPGKLVPTQNLPPIYEENSNIYIFTAASFSKQHRRIGCKPILFPIDRMEAVDIDEYSDFAFAEFLMQKRLREKL